MSLPREFASDNTAPVHTAVLDALVAANHGPSPAYGADPWTARAVDWFQAQFGRRNFGLSGLERHRRQRRLAARVDPPLAGGDLLGRRRTSRWTSVAPLSCLRVEAPRPPDARRQADAGDGAWPR